MKILIFGLGNPLRTDDGVGIEIAKKLEKEKLSDSCGVDVKYGNIEPFDLLEIIDGYDHLIIIDAAKITNREIGYIHHYKLDELKSYPLRTSHGVDLKTAIEIGKATYRLPENIDIYGIVASDCVTFGEGLSQDLNKKLEEIMNQIISRISGILERYDG